MPQTEPREEPVAASGAAVPPDSPVVVAAPEVLLIAESEPEPDAAREVAAAVVEVAAAVGVDEQQAEPPSGRVRPAEERRPRRPPPMRHTIPRLPTAPSSEVEAGAVSEGPVDPASLFPPKAEGRAPADWHGRLDAAARAAIAGEPSRAPTRTPISEGARRSLRPLVGLDPAEVVLHRGARVEPLTAAHGADALALGEEIAVGVAGSDDEPQMLGLLAHELTHVARYRAPRFIPPVVRGTRAADGAKDADEEILAAGVERRVRAIAQRRSDAAVPVPQEETPEPVADEERAGAVAQRPAGSASARRDWGGLPAPWEPMPDIVWQAPAFASAPEITTSPSAAGADVTTSAVMHRAASDREQAAPPPAAPAAPAPAGAEQGRPAADLDALARQVYTVLRRRLAAERRRDG
jgi:hypothetical protein